MTLSAQLMGKIKALNETLWRNRAQVPKIEQWLEHFDDPAHGTQDRLIALYLLSQFSYFETDLLRELLRAMYRDRIKYPEVARIRRANGDSTDVDQIATAYAQSLKATRFLGMGNPAESGTHLLYLFRQSNGLSKDLFVHPHELFDYSNDPPSIKRGVRRVVFIDDLAASGSQATRYSNGIASEIRKRGAEVSLEYHVLFATERALRKLDTGTVFDRIEAVARLDSSFKSVSSESRYFPSGLTEVDCIAARRMAKRYGRALFRGAPLGFKDCELLLGFAHNIPNNSLPIFWHGGNQHRRWRPTFPRQHKVEG